MPYSFTLPVTHTFTSPDPDDPLEDGEDIAMSRSGSIEITPAGDWGVVKGLAAAKQSVLRELPANPGEFARRPEWGGGLSGLIFRGSTSATRDEAASRGRARLRANPRISGIANVSARPSDDGFELTVRASTPAGKLNIENEVIKP